MTGPMVTPSARGSPTTQDPVRRGAGRPRRTRRSGSGGTYSRFAAMQTWPAGGEARHDEPSIASGSKAASDEEDRGVVAAELHAPSGVSRSAAAAAIARPASSPPVKATLRDQPGAPTSAVDRSRRRRARPARRRPAGAAGRAGRSALRRRAGASGEGLTMTALPAASAAASLSIARMTGAFHGVTAATTPYGRCGCAAAGPPRRRAPGRRRAPAACSTTQRRHRDGEPDLAAAVGAAACRSPGPSAPRGRRARRRSRRRRRAARRAARRGAVAAQPAERGVGARGRRRRPGRGVRVTGSTRADELVGAGRGSPARMLRPTAVIRRRLSDLPQRVDHRGIEQVARGPRPGRRRARAARRRRPRRRRIAQLLPVAVGDLLHVGRATSRRAAASSAVIRGVRRRPRRPWREDRVVDAAVHAHPAERVVDVRGVARQQQPARSGTRRRRAGGPGRAWCAATCQSRPEVGDAAQAGTAGRVVLDGVGGVRRGREQDPPVVGGAQQHQPLDRVEDVVDPAMPGRSASRSSSVGADQEPLRVGDALERVAEQRPAHRGVGAVGTDEPVAAEGVAGLRPSPPAPSWVTALDALVRSGRCPAGSRRQQDPGELALLALQAEGVRVSPASSRMSSSAMTVAAAFAVLEAGETQSLREQRGQDPELGEHLQATAGGTSRPATRWPGRRRPPGR